MFFESCETSTTAVSEMRNDFAVEVIFSLHFHRKNRKILKCIKNRNLDQDVFNDFKNLDKKRSPPLKERLS